MQSGRVAMKVSRRDPARIPKQNSPLPERYEIVPEPLQLTHEQVVGQKTQVSSTVVAGIAVFVCLFFLAYGKWLSSESKLSRALEAHRSFVDQFCLYRKYNAFSANAPNCGVMCSQRQSLQLIAAAEANNFAQVHCGEPVLAPSVSYGIIQASLPERDLGLIVAPPE